MRLLFELVDAAVGQPGAERMWLTIVELHPDGYVGALKNQPRVITDLSAGDQVRFGPEHIIAVDNPEWRPFEDKLAFATARLLHDDSLEPRLVVHSTDDEGKAQKATGDIASGWEIYVGDETTDELSVRENVRLPNLAWLMERYPAFGDLVFSGAREGEWELREGKYVPTAPRDEPATPRRRRWFRRGSA